MEVLEAMETRRSIRRYRPEAIPEEDLRKIMQAAQLAPSAGNRQPWRFIVARGEETRRMLAEAARKQMWIADAGAVVVALSMDPSDPEVYARWVERDVMTAVEHMVLAAWSLGYGTCWIGAFEEERVKEILGIPEKMRVINLLPIGVPDHRPDAKPRKPLRELFHLERYGDPLRL
jgi:nitroreductase